MTDAQRQTVHDAVVEIHERLALYAARYAGLADPHDLVNAVVMSLIAAAEKDFSTYTQIRNLFVVLKRRIRRRVRDLLQEKEAKDAGELVDGRVRGVRRVRGKKADPAKKPVLTEIRLDADDTGAHKAHSEAAVRQGGSQPELAAIINRETAEQLARAIATLQPKLKEYVELRFIAELTAEEVREAMKANAKQMDRWREKALKKLHRLIVDEQTAREQKVQQSRNELRRRSA